MAKIRTRARALDMLGRQQIAGIPTALSELFKNAHDAYAENVEVDYIRKKNLLVLRDDGLGMTREEFEQRWLTIGTDSKFSVNGSIGMPVIDSTKPFRAVMGEKGIGRLSIAAIGPQVLVLTRAERDGKLHNLVAAFVNWSLFTLPGLDLEDIEIPITEIPDGKPLTKQHLSDLLDEAKSNVSAIQEKLKSTHLDQITRDLDTFSEIDPEVWQTKLQGPSLLENGTGTHFIISPIDDALPDDIAQFSGSRRTDQASRLEKALLGFTNTMRKDYVPPIRAKFRDHTWEGDCIERIDGDAFFTPEEFKISDHHIIGEFNEFGQFNGTIQIYGEEPKPYTLPWLDGKNKPISCGPFSLNIGYIQGAQQDTQIPPEIWRPLRDKTDRIGGLYIYRDNIRVLPYGDSDMDFLRVEQRRTKSAGVYFFSYRRMIGSIELTRQDNGNLHEKAGREGFIENNAYKQFKAVLENFFIQLAADFFNDKGDLSDQFIEERNRLQREYKLLKKRKLNVTAKRRKLSHELEKYFSLLNEDYWKNKVQNLSSWVDVALKSFNSKNGIENLLENIDENVDEKLKNLYQELAITKPAGVGLSKDLAESWDRYQTTKRITIEEVLQPFKREVSLRLIKFEDSHGNRADLRRRFLNSVSNQTSFQQQRIKTALNEVTEATKDLQSWVNDVVQNSKETAKNGLYDAESDFAQIDFDSSSQSEIYNLKAGLEAKIDNTAQEVIERIERLSGQLNIAREGSQENAISSHELTATLETELETLRVDYQNSMEMAQLGMAIGVIQHEFGGNVRSIRHSLKELNKWAAKNAKLKDLYTQLRTSFDHLDGYLALFTPLSRRLNRRKVKVTGNAVSDFLKSVFEERLEEIDAQFVFTERFYSQAIVSYTSTIYPAFINIVDNSLYWLSKTDGERTITFDACEDGFRITDNGPGISTKDRDVIFKFGFSRKPNGRGMGLYITQTTLNQTGFDLILEEYRADEGASFIIKPKQEQENIEHGE